MILTKSQQSRFWREWSAVVDYNKWPETWSQMEIDRERRALLQRAGFTSLTLVDRGAGFDRVLAELGRMRDDVLRTVEIDNDEPGQRRRLIYKIRQFAHPLGGEPYVLALARDKFHITTGLSTIENLALDQLNHLMVTLNARRKSRERSNATNRSLTSEETFPDQVEFQPEPELVGAVECPF